MIYRKKAIYFPYAGRILIGEKEQLVVFNHNLEQQQQQQQQQPTTTTNMQSTEQLKSNMERNLTGFLCDPKGPVILSWDAMLRCKDVWTRAEEVEDET